MKNKVTIIIPYYDGLESLKKVISSIGSEFPIIIINNSNQKLQFSQKNISIIELHLNSGFAHACNLGWLKAESKWLLFINPDITLKDQDILELVKEAEANNLDALSPQLLNGSQKVDLKYHQQIPNPLQLLLEFTPLKKLALKKNNAKTTLPGACLLIKNTVLDDLNGWDERFFLWFEDSDLSYRLHQNNFNFRTSSHIKIQHQGAETFEPLSQDFKLTTFFHSMDLFAQKHFSLFAQIVIKKLVINKYKTKKLYPLDQKIKLSLVIPNLKKSELENFFKKNQFLFSNKSVEIIIVTSVKNTLKLRQEYPSVLFIYIQKNNGFASTVNLGIKRARGRLIGTVNDDVILNKAFLKKCKETKVLNTLTVASFSPIIKNQNNEIESAGVDIEKKGKAAVRKQYKSSNPDTFNAACVVFSRHALEKAGLFDERFSSYLEDLDLGLRMKSKGFKHLVFEDVTVTHLGQQTSKDFKVYKSWLDFKNWILLITNNLAFFELHNNFLDLVVERAKNFSGFIKSWKNR